MHDIFILHKAVTIHSSASADSSFFLPIKSLGQFIKLLLRRRSLVLNPSSLTGASVLRGVCAFYRSCKSRPEASEKFVLFLDLSRHAQRFVLFPDAVTIWLYFEWWLCLRYGCILVGDWLNFEEDWGWLCLRFVLTVWLFSEGCLRVTILWFCSNVSQFGRLLTVCAYCLVVFVLFVIPFWGCGLRYIWKMAWFSAFFDSLFGEIVLCFVANAGLAVWITYYRCVLLKPFDNFIGYGLISFSVHSRLILR